MTDFLRSYAPPQKDPLDYITPSRGDVAGAAFRINNPLTSVYQSLMGQSENQLFDPKFNPLEEPGFKGSKYEQKHLERFVGIPNRDAYAALKSRIDAQDADRETLDIGGGFGIAASMLASLVDPTLAIPFGGAVRAAHGGISLLRTAGKVGALSGLQSTIQEAVLQGTQETRTLGEGALNIASGTIVGALLGTGLAGLVGRADRRAIASAAELKAVEKALDKDRITLTGESHPLARGEILPRASDAFPDERFADKSWQSGENLRSLTPAEAAIVDDPSVKVHEPTGKLVRVDEDGKIWGFTKTGKSRAETSVGGNTRAWEPKDGVSASYVEDLQAGQKAIAEAASASPGAAAAGNAPAARPLTGETIPPKKPFDQKAYDEMVGGDDEFDAMLRESTKERFQQYLDLERQFGPKPTADQLDILQDAEEGLLEVFRMAGLPGDGLERIQPIYSVSDIKRAFANASPEELAKYWLNKPVAERPASVHAAAVDAGSEGRLLGAEGSVGSAAADRRQLELKPFLPDFITRWVPPSMQNIASDVLLATSPTLRTAKARLVSGKRAMFDMVEGALHFKDSDAGIPTSSTGTTIDRMVKTEKTRRTLQTSEELLQQFLEYRGKQETPKTGRIRAAYEDVTGGSDKMTFGEFKAEVFRASVNGDKHAIPQVQKAAEFYRKDQEQVKAWLQTVMNGDRPMLGDVDAPKGDESHMTRLWNNEAIAKNRFNSEGTGIVNIFHKWLTGEQATKAEAKDRIAALSDKHSELTDRLHKLEAVTERLDLRDKKLAAQIEERARDVNRLDKRVDVLAERRAMIQEARSDIAEFIADTRAHISNPEARARLDDLQKEAADLLKQEERLDPTTDKILEIERQEVDRVLKEGDNRIAAGILLGERKRFKAPSFWQWVAKSGGVVDVGGDLANLIGGARRAPGLIRKDPGMGGLAGPTSRRTLDEVGQDIIGAYSKVFSERVGEGGLAEGRAISPDEVAQWISDSFHGKEPDWWTKVHGDTPLSRATEIADQLEEAMQELDIPISRKNIAKYLRGETPDGALPEVVDAIARMDEAARQTAIKRTEVSDTRDALRQDFAHARAALESARSKAESKAAAQGKSEARLGEAGVEQGAVKSRFQILHDHAVLTDIKRAITEQARAIAEKEADKVRNAMEEELRQWKGNSAADAIAALKSREKAGGENERIAGKQAEADDHFMRLRDVAGDDVAGMIGARYPEEGRVRTTRDRSADDAVNSAVKSIIASDRDLSSDELLSIANQWVNRIQDGPHGRVDYDAKSPSADHGPASDGSPMRGSLLGRSAAIPTNLVMPFVHHDIEHVYSRFLSTVLPDGRIAERFGDIEMTEVVRQINDEALKHTLTAKSAAEAQRIEKERSTMVRDVTAVRDRLRGIWGYEANQGNFAKWVNRFQSYNVMTDLGTTALNSANDMAFINLRYAMTSVFRDGYLPYIGGMIKGGDAFTGAAKRQAKAAMIAVETWTNMRNHALTDVLDHEHQGNKFDRIMRGGADASQLVNVQAQYTDFTKTVSTAVIGADLARAMEKVTNGTATAADRANLASKNISTADAAAIWKEFTTGQGGEKIKGVWFANTAEWSSERLRQVYEGALAREADIAVITPGQEKGLSTSQPFFKMIGQFKAFVAAAHERVLLAGLQQRDAKTLAGLASSIAMGILSYRLYTLVSGQTFDTDPSSLLKEGISRSGVMGWFDEINSIQSKLSRGQTDMYRLIGADKPLSRYASRGLLESITGPTAGKLVGAGTAVGAAFSGDFSGGDTSRARRLLPFQNNFFIRNLLNEAEEGFNNLMGIPQKQPPKPKVDASGVI